MGEPPKHTARARHANGSDAADVDTLAREWIAAANEPAAVPNGTPEPEPDPEPQVTASSEAGAVTNGTPEPSPGHRAVELRAFLAEQEADYDWLIPGVIERGDRVITTGAEGGGKSTLLRQIGVQLACGLHPFKAAEPIDPARVLLVDLENPGKLFRRELAKLEAAAGELYDGDRFRVWHEPTGINLLHRADADLLAAEVEAHRAELVVIGPHYKLAEGDPASEEVGKAVAKVLDQLRAEHGCALLIEAHSPHASNGAKRPCRPYGWSGWLRWPEFGLHLGEDDTLSHYRNPRDEREWPHRLLRGGAWPFSVKLAEGTEWPLIERAARAAGQRLSVRELAARTGMNRNRVQRLIGSDGPRATDYEMLTNRLETERPGIPG